MSETSKGGAQPPQASKFAIAALMGVFEDDAQFPDPFGLGTIFTVRRAGSNKLQALLRERAKGDKLQTLMAQSIFSAQAGGSNIMDLAAQAGIHPVDVLAKIGEARTDDALGRLVKWEHEPNGVEYNSGNARELLTHDGWLDKAMVPEASWKILEDQLRKEHEALKTERKVKCDACGHEMQIDGTPPYPGLTDIQVGPAYAVFFRYWSEQKESFRAQALEEAAKN